MIARKIGFGLMVVVVAIGVANAQDDMKGWYIGVGAGSASIEVKVEVLTLINVCRREHHRGQACSVGTAR